MSQEAIVFTGSLETGQWGEVRKIGVPEVPAGMLLVKAVAYAANPTDWKHVALGMGKKGDVIGSDVAGYVEKVGSGVNGFKVGDKVGLTLHGNISSVNGAFQDYVLVDAPATVLFDGIDESKVLSPGSHGPGAIDSFEAAASAPLSLATMAVSFLYNSGIPMDKEANKDKTVLIWGGATAAGIYGIQLASKLLGVKVIATASRKHHDYLKLLGANVVIDYHDADAIEQIKAAGEGKFVYALDTVSDASTWQSLYDATKGSSPVTLDNLLMLNAGNLRLDPSRDNDDVKFKQTLVYQIVPESQGPIGFGINANKDLEAKYQQFSSNHWASFLQQVRTPALTVLKPGLLSANEALDLLRLGKTSGEKIVWRHN